MKHLLIHVVISFLFCAPSLLMASPSIDAMLVKPLHEREEIAERFWQQREFRRAKKQYLIMARLGSKHAQNRLAIMNMNGWGMKKDPVQAWVWSALAAEFNDPVYAGYRDDYWKELSLDQREEAVEQLQRDMLIFMDQRVAAHIEVKARRKLRMDTIGYGLLPQGLVKTWRVEGMAGDPANTNLVNMLRNIQYISYQHARGERVTIGELRILDEESPPTPLMPEQENPEDSGDSQ